MDGGCWRYMVWFLVSSDLIQIPLIIFNSSVWPRKHFGKYDGHRALLQFDFIWQPFCVITLTRELLSCINLNVVTDKHTHLLYFIAWQTENNSENSMYEQRIRKGLKIVVTILCAQHELPHTKHRGKSNVPQATFFKTLQGRGEGFNVKLFCVRF